MEVFENGGSTRQVCKQIVNQKKQQKKQQQKNKTKTAVLRATIIIKEYKRYARYINQSGLTNCKTVIPKIKQSSLSLFTLHEINVRVLPKQHHFRR